MYIMQSAETLHIQGLNKLHSGPIHYRVHCHCYGQMFQRLAQLHVVPVVYVIQKCLVHNFALHAVLRHFISTVISPLTSTTLCWLEFVVHCVYQLHYHFIYELTTTSCVTFPVHSATLSS